MSRIHVTNRWEVSSHVADTTRGSAGDLAVGGGDSGGMGGLNLVLVLLRRSSDMFAFRIH